MRYLTSYELIAINARIDIHQKQQPGLAKAEQLNRVIAIPQADFYENSLREAVSNKTGYLFASIVRGKPFVDNNYQTAIIEVAELANLNDYELTFSSQEMVDLAKKIDQTKNAELDYGPLFKLFNEHLKSN